MKFAKQVLDYYRNSLGSVFLWTVLIPTSLAIFYYGFIAEDTYISETKFVIRTPERQAESGLGVILKGAGITGSSDDSFAVQEYIKSRDALKQLNKKLNTKAAYEKGDFISRFPGIDGDQSFEAMYAYYQKMLTVKIDPQSSIVTVYAYAFDAKDTMLINTALLEMSEKFVNQLNDRARQDMIGSAKKEVAAAVIKAKNATIELAKYRNENSVLDPEKQASLPMQQAIRLQEELVNARTQLRQLELLAPSNPQVPTIKTRIQILEEEIGRVSGNVTGGTKSLATKAVGYQQLALEKEFSDKMLSSAMAGLEQAVSVAQRKQIYLERIAEPSHPDIALEPRRIRSILSVLLIGLISWGIFSMLLAGIKEHQD